MKEPTQFEAKPDNGFGGNEKYELGDVRFLFDEKNQDALAQKIEAAGYEVLSDTEVNGERVTEVAIPNGDHLFSFGFRQINPAEERWFHGGLDDQERREEFPFTFDVESPEFREILEDFSESIGRIDNLEAVVGELNAVLQSKVKSDLREEDAHSLSEILQTGSAACASKSVLAGSILKEHYPDLRVETIYGYYGLMRDKVSLPFGHEWMRISDGAGAVLYDPMYDKELYYPFDTKPKPDNSFSRYTVSALPFAKLHSMIGLTAVGNSLKLIEGHAGTEREFVIEDDHAVEAQLGGQLTGMVRASGGILRLVNGNISNEVSEDGPRLLYPLLHIEKSK